MDKIQAISDAAKAAVNPFARLVNSATDNDGTTGISYYTCEQVKEAAHQSEYGCEWVQKTLVARLDSSSIHTVYKALVLMRMLLLEGPQQFAERMSSSGSLQKIHNVGFQQYQDALKDSLENSVKQLAQAIHMATTGGGNSCLLNIGNNNSNSNSNAGGGSQSREPSKGGSAKSAFQQEQLKELRNFRKRQAEERSGGVVISDKNHLSFNAQLTPGKLIESVLNADKKKFAQEEIFSFVDAVVGNSKPVDCIMMMEKLIGDARYSIAQRHKMLQFVEGIVMIQSTNQESGQPTELGLWWRAHTGNLQKMTTLEAPENPAKAKQMQEISKRVLDVINGIYAGGGSDVAPAALNPSQLAPAAAPAATASVPQPQVPVVEVASTKSQQQQQQQQQRSRGTSVASKTSENSSSSSSQQQQQQRPRGASTSASGAVYGVQNINPAFAMDDSSATGGNMFGGLTVKASSSSGATTATTTAKNADPFSFSSTAPSTQPQPPADIFAVPAAPAPQPVAPAAPPAAAGAGGGGDDVMRKLQEQFQQSMAMMAKLGVASSAPSAPPPAWGSSVTSPPPIPEPVVPVVAAPAHVDPAPPAAAAGAASSPEAAAPPPPQTSSTGQLDERENSSNKARSEDNATPPVVAWQQAGTAGLSASGNANSDSNLSFGNVGGAAGSNASLTSLPPAVPNNSMVDAGAAAAAAAAMQHAAQLQAQMSATAAATPAPAPAPASSIAESNRSVSETSSSVGVVAPSAASPMMYVPSNPHRTPEDAALIQLLQLQLTGAQQQIANQNQMLAVMQQQIAALMARK